MDKSLRKIGFQKIWDSPQGGSKGVNVGITDTGAPNLSDTRFYDWIGDKPPAPPWPSQPSKIKLQASTVPSASGADGHGHGTMMHYMTILNPINWPAPVTEKMGGVYRAYAYSCKVLSDAGSGQYSWIIAGLKKLADETPVDVINVSLGGGVHDQAIDDAVEYCVNKGIVVCIANGNSGSNRSPFAACDRSLCCPGDSVTAVNVGGSCGGHELGPDFKEYVQTWSSRPPSYDNRKPPDTARQYVIAPGLNIELPAHSGGTSGTSLATPHVTASAAAIIWKIIQKHPELRRTRQIVEMVWALLLKTTLSLGYDTSGNWTKEEAYCIQGYGRVQVDKAIDLVDGTEPPPGKYAVSEWHGQFTIIRPVDRKPSRIEGQFSRDLYLPEETVAWSGKLMDANTSVGLANRQVAWGYQNKNGTATTDTNGIMQIEFIEGTPAIYDMAIVFAGDP